MKRIFLLIIAAVFSTAMFAQTVSTPTDNLLLILKSVQKTGNDVEINGLLTNCSQSEIVVSLVGGQYQNGVPGSVAYDNEGNIYELHDILVAVARKAYTEQYSSVTIPSGVSIKVRMCIKNLDQEATELSKIKLCILSSELAIENTGVCFEMNNIPF